MNASVCEFTCFVCILTTHNKKQNATNHAREKTKLVFILYRKLSQKIVIWRSDLRLWRQKVWNKKYYRSALGS